MLVAQMCQAFASGSLCLPFFCEEHLPKYLHCLQALTDYPPVGAAARLTSDELGHPCQPIVHILPYFLFSNYHYLTYDAFYFLMYLSSLFLTRI